MPQAEATPNRIFKVTLAVCALLVSALPIQSTRAARAPMDAKTTERIATFERSLVAPGFRDQTSASFKLQDRMAHYCVPAVSVAVIENGKIAWAKAWGVGDAGKPAAVTPNTVFQAASLSKPVTALAALALVERGQLQLDGPINASLKSWNIPGNTLLTNQVTLRMLLSHKAGLSVGGFAGYEAGKPVPSTLQVLSGSTPANSGPVQFMQAPGSPTLYSGGGYTVVQQAMEDASGQGFADVVTSAVLSPLGMTRSSFAPPQPNADFAAGHNKTKPIPGLFRTHPELAAAGLWSTPSDLAKFAISIAGTTSAASGQPVRSVLNGHLSGQMRQSHGKVGYDFGLGLSIGNLESGRTFGHLGANAGYQSAMLVYEGGTHGAVVMTNADEGGWLIREILGAIAVAHNWPDYLPPVRQTQPLAGADLAKAAAAWTGEHQTASGVSVRVRQSGNNLYARMESADGKELTSVQGWHKLHALAPTANSATSSAANAFAVGTSPMTLHAGSDGKPAHMESARLGTLNFVSRGQPVAATAALSNSNARYGANTAYEIFLRGGFNDWGFTAPLLRSGQPLPNTSQGTTPSSMIGSAEVELREGLHEFKFADPYFEFFDQGALPEDAPIQAGTPGMALAVAGSNAKVQISKPGKYRFELHRSPAGAYSTSVVAAQ